MDDILKKVKDLLSSTGYFKPEGWLADGKIGGLIYREGFLEKATKELNHGCICVAIYHKDAESFIISMRAMQPNNFKLQLYNMPSEDKNQNWMILSGYENFIIGGIDNDIIKIDFKKIKKVFKDITDLKESYQNDYARYCDRVINNVWGQYWNDVLKVLLAHGKEMSTHTLKNIYNHHYSWLDDDTLLKIKMEVYPQEVSFKDYIDSIGEEE